MDLALWLLLSTFTVELTTWIGSDSLGSLVYAPLAPASRSLKDKKAEILSLRAELAATSSQDEFSKWARLRRKLDKAVADLEATNSTIASERKAFLTKFKTALWILTTVVPFVLSSYHRKSAVFYLPDGWFGGLGWWLSLPSAPAGALAVGLWTMACKRTLTSVKNAVTELVPTPAERTARHMAKEQVKQQQQEERVKVGVTAKGGEEKVSESKREKKEV
ncbi:hypothetical protein JCM11641_000201 [Rhodosporidiobolus odoratus]